MWTSTETLKLVCAKVSLSSSTKTQKRRDWQSKKWTACRFVTRRSACNWSTLLRGVRWVPMRTTSTLQEASRVSWTSCQRVQVLPATPTCSVLPSPLSLLLTSSWPTCSKWRVPPRLFSTSSRRKCRLNVTSLELWSVSLSSATIKAIFGSSTLTLLQLWRLRSPLMENSSIMSRFSVTSSLKIPTRPE